MTVERKKHGWQAPKPEMLKPFSMIEMCWDHVCLGDIILRLSSGRLMRLKRAGDFLNSDWCKRFANNSSLLFLPKSKPELMKDLKGQFSAWKDQTDPESSYQELQKLKTNLAELFRTEKLTLLEWAIVAFTQFSPDKTAMGTLEEGDVLLCQRGLYVSALATLFAFLHGYHDFVFLKDLYQVSWLLDMGLVDKRFSYRVALACQAERKGPGEGEELLKKMHASADEVGLFIGHTARGFEWAMANMQSQMNFPEVLSAISNHHEKSDGSGFPKGLSRSSMPDWEMCVAFADCLVSHEDHTLEEYAGLNLIEIFLPFTRETTASKPMKKILLRVYQWFKGPVRIAPEVGAA